VLDYAASVGTEGRIGLDDLPELRSADTPARPATAAPAATDPDWLQALREHHWNVSEVARRLGLSRMTLYRRMQRAGVVPPNRAG